MRRQHGLVHRSAERLRHGVGLPGACHRPRHLGRRSQGSARLGAAAALGGRRPSMAAIASPAIGATAAAAGTATGSACNAPSTAAATGGRARRAASPARPSSCRRRRWPSPTAGTSSACKATSSDSWTIENHFVPHAYAVRRDTASERRVQTPLYLFPSMMLYATGFSGVAIGAGRALVREFIDLAKGKTRAASASRCATIMPCRCRSPRRRRGCAAPTVSC